MYFHVRFLVTDWYSRWRGVAAAYLLYLVVDVILSYQLKHKYYRVSATLAEKIFCKSLAG